MKYFRQLCFALGLLTLPITAWSGKYDNPALNPVKFKPVENQPPLELVQDGKLNFAIVFDMSSEKNVSACRQSIHQAVEALKDAFKRSSGQTPPVIDANSADIKKYRYLIAVGKSKITDELGMKPLQLPPEGFEVKTFPGGVAIAGYDGSMINNSYKNLDSDRYRFNGTANGAYDFIERIIGLRFYYPGIGTYVPVIKNLVVEPVSYADAPEYKDRFNWAASSALNKDWPWPKVSNDSRFVEASWRMAIATRYSPSHSPRPELMGKTFPDKLDTIFYRDPSGHLYYTPVTHMGNLYDVSNPDFAGILIECYKKFYATDGKWRSPWLDWYPPNSEYVLFGQTDTTGVIIQNSRTNGLVFPQQGNNGVMSDVYARFHIELAEMLKKELPDKKLGVIFYESYTMPPVKIRNFPDNIRGTLCTGVPAYMKSNVYQQYLTKIFKEWAEILHRPVGAWSYGISNNFTRALQGRYMRDYLQLLSPYLWRDNVYLDAEGMNWNFYYSYYLEHRSLWNPEFNIDAAMDEHWKLLYGPAAPYLKQFYDMIRDRWEKYYIPELNAEIEKGNSVGSLGTEQWNISRLYLKTYPPAVINDLENLLKQAEKAVVSGSIESERVLFFVRPWAAEFTSARAYGALDIPIYKVKHLEGTITIDGKLDETAWKNAAVMNIQDARGRGSKLESSPEMRLLWSDEGLYIACKMSGKGTAKAGDLWNSDNLEIFLSPGMEKNEYCQVAVSAAGDFHSGLRRLKPFPAAFDNKWRCAGLQHKENIDGDNWTMEMFIPFKGLDVNEPVTHKCWFGNFITNNVAFKDYGAFCMTMGNNHNTDLFGMLKFMGKGD